MKNKLKNIFKILTVAAGCLMFASFSPSLDGRAVVVDEGVFPQGLFAKTVGYLPGDIISVTNIAGDSTVDILVIGALDPSEGVAIMLSPEAADAIGIDKSSNNIVKITKRSGQEERVYGNAVVSKSAAELEDYDDGDFDSISAEENTEAFEEPETEEPAEEEAPAEEAPAEEALAEEAEPEEESFDDEAEEEFTEEPAEEPEEEAGEPEENEDFDEEADFEEEAEEPEEEPVDEEAVEEEPLDEEEPEELEESAPAAEEEEAPAEEAPAEEEEEAPEEAFEEEQPEALEEEIAPEAFEEDELDELPAEEPEEEEAPVENAEETEEAPAEEFAEDSDSEEYEAIVLVPADSNPPESESDEVEDVAADELDAIEEETVSAIESIPEEKPAADTKKSGVTSYEKYMVPSLKDLESGKYYIQIAVYSADENINEILEKYANNYPVTIVPMAGGQRKQILIGPVTMDEYKVVLERFKSYGFKDAFLRKVK